MSSFDEPAEVRTAAPPPTPEAKEPDQPPFSDEAWGQTARALVLLAFLGMALCVTVRLSFGGDWVFDFLKANELDMGVRLRLIIQMVGTAGAFVILALLSMALKWTRSYCHPENLERWAWFLSPLILAPAPCVVLRHELWVEHHQDLLPIVLFGGLLAEFFFSQAISHVPAPALRFFRWLLSDSDDDAGAAQPVSAKERALHRLGRAQTWIASRGPLLVVVAAACAYGAFMSFYTVRWHHKLGTAIFDLGINNNLLFGGLSGHFNESTVIFPDDPQKYLANHVKWGIYGFLPIYALFPRAETLLIIQSISIGLGAIPLFLFTKDRLPAWWAAALALCYLSYYPLHGANFYEMKLVSTAAAVVLCCVWAIDTRRYVLGAVTFAWALIMREDLPVPLAVIGATFLLSGRRPVAGIIMAGIASSWFIFLRFRFMNEVGSWWFPNMYKDLWAAPERGFQGVVKTLVSNPSFTLKHIFVEKKFWYLMHLLTPLLFLPLRRWYTWVALVPGAILTLLVTDYAPPLMFSFQYVMHWAPYLFLASGIVLAAKLNAPSGRAPALGALIAMCLTTAALCYNYGAFPARDKTFKSGYSRVTFGFDEEERARYRDLARLVASIPSEASLAATEHTGAHLSSRFPFYTLRRDSHGVMYIVARKKELSLDKTRRTIYRALSSGEYGVEARFGEFIVFKKGAATDKNEAVIDEWNLQHKRSKRRSSLRTDTPGDDSEDDEETQEDDEEQVDDTPPME